MKTAKEWVKEFNEKSDGMVSNDFLKDFITQVQEDTALYAVQALHSNLVKHGLLKWVKLINSK